MLVVKVCMVWLLSVHRVVVGRVYHVCASWWRVVQRLAVAVSMDVRGMVVNASVRSKWIMVCCGLVW